MTKIVYVLFITLLTMITKVEALSIISSLRISDKANRTGYTNLHCRGSMGACTSRIPGMRLSCKESCRCQGFYFGVCEKDITFCKPYYPVSCKCQGYWFGVRPNFCSTVKWY